MSDTEQTRVGHAIEDDGEIDVYAGRGSGKRAMGELPVGKRGWLGNPYTTFEYSREDAIARFREDFEARLESDDEFREAVRDLAGQNLGCWCQTLDEDGPACHAEVIAEHADRLAREVRADGGDPLPWCLDCEAYAPPTDAGDCGECGTAVEWRGGERR